MTAAIYAGLHFLVDMTCAAAMFHRFIPASYESILLYNFCAFALQMPLGALLDLLFPKHRHLPSIFASLGTGLTMLGFCTHPAVLGLGNALFHVGGGIVVIGEDAHNQWDGKALGIFVAPGALGLFLGGQLPFPTALIFALMAILTLFVLRCQAFTPAAPPSVADRGRLFPLLCCFAVVILRSYVGMSVTFPWKTGLFPGFISVLAVVLGKCVGGFRAGKIGAFRTSLLSLGFAAVCFALGSHPIFGIAALFLFNMTMPITLYQLWLRYPGQPGFSFGLLTFGLFLGFLPVYLGWQLPISGTWGSLISLALLIPVVRRQSQ